MNPILAVLVNCHTIAVVGLSIKPNRASHDVARYMQENGYRIIPVNPTYAGTNILGELCYSTLIDAAAALSKTGHQIDLVNCFRRSEEISPIADDAIAIGARCLWLQLGIINQDAAKKAAAAGLVVVMDRCIKIEHMRQQVK